MILAAAHGPSALWYATRGAGAVALVLLTISVALGIAELRGWSPGKTPRFAIATLHRNASLLAVVVLVVHIVTTLLDPFPHIGIVSALVPFVDPYRPLWLGMGTLAFDLLLALVLTSLVRRRLGYRAWRGVHWLAYACWPVAVLHGLGTGSDSRATWMLALTLGCVAVVAAAVVSRLTAGQTTPRGRTAGATALVAAGIGLAVWLPQGPLAHGWARRAGTPASVLDAFRPHAAQARQASRTPAPAADPLDQPFSAALEGVVRSGVSRGGTSVADLSMRLRGGPSGVLRIRLGGDALADGGLQMRRSAVFLGPPSDPGRYAGRVEQLDNTRVRALVGSGDGRSVRIDIRLSLNGQSVSGQVVGRPVGATGA